MKKSIAFLVTFMFLTFLCGCQNPTIHDSPAPDSSASSSVHQEDFESIYQFNKPLIEKDGHLEIEALHLPYEINDMKTAVSNVLSESQLLMLLYEENPAPVIKEVGVYDLTNGEYKTSFSLEQGRTISIKCVADGLMIYTETDIASNIVQLNYCDLNTGERIEIYQFSPEYGNTSAVHNNILSRGGKIYFDDVVTDGDEMVGVNLLEYDLQTKEVTLYRKNAQNPLWLDFGLAYISKDENTGLYFIESSADAEKIYLNQRISMLAPAWDELYAINNKSNDPQTRRTIWSMNSLRANEELLLSSNAIDQLVANQDVVAWRNFTPERPVIYLRKLDSFTILLEDEIAYNTYLLGDEGGILICSHDDSPTTYYKFS